LSVCESCSPGMSPSYLRAYVELLIWSGTSAITKIPTVAVAAAAVVVARRWRKAIRKTFFYAHIGREVCLPRHEEFGNADIRPLLKTPARDFRLRDTHR